VLIGSTVTRHEPYLSYKEVENSSVCAYVREVLSEADIPDAASVAVYYNPFQHEEYKAGYRSIILNEMTYYNLAFQFANVTIQHNGNEITMPPIKNTQQLATNKEQIKAVAPDITRTGEMHMFLAHLCAAVATEGLWSIIAPHLGVPAYTYDYALTQDDMTTQHWVALFTTILAKVSFMELMNIVYYYANRYGDSSKLSH
jgi:hypothetical protein